MNRLAPLLALLVGCPASDTDDTDTDTDSGAASAFVPWQAGLPDAATAIAPLRGRVHQRAVFHAHSPYSHDACDGDGWVDGVIDTDCADQLRAALCTLRFDTAFLTDHPSHAAGADWADLFHGRPGDTLLRDGDDVLANEIACEGGHTLRWRMGYEDDLMPVGMRRHVPGDAIEREALLNRSDADAIAAMEAAGGTVMMAHTEGRDLERLKGLQDLGLHAVEAYNVHAMLAPDIRGEDLGLDPFGWADAIGPFIARGSELEPDLLFLAVHEHQPPSLAKWDALLQRGPMMATAGSDSHQNVLPSVLSDGERVDSYRRTLKWFSTMLIADEASVAAHDEAVASRRAFIAFEALGTPTGFDVHLDAGGTIHEMGSDAPTGDLVVACPELAPGSPRGEDDPEIAVRVLKDGEPWQTGCGRWPAERGVYRVEVDITPHHLTPFLGADPSPYLKPYPWLYSGAIRVAMD